ncbi:Hypothetical protein D9617_13g100570 [Elsinoe fawcettii]|nr:Hypothetical protein D9617_13g100570 [Elsinoe fawcettii]
MSRSARLLLPLAAQVLGQTCQGGRYAQLASEISGFAPATSFCSSKYPVAPTTTTATASATTLTTTVATSTATLTTSTDTTVSISSTTTFVATEVDTSTIATVTATTYGTVTSTATSTVTVTVTRAPVKRNKRGEEVITFWMDRNHKSKLKRQLSTTRAGPSTTPAAPSTTPRAPSTTPAAPSTTPRAPSTTPAAPSTTPRISTTPAAPSTTPIISTTPAVPSTTPVTTTTTTTSASPAATNCGLLGYDKNSPNAYSVSNRGLSDCYTLCQSSNKCKTFASGKTNGKDTCYLYGSTLPANFKADRNAPYKFYASNCVVGSATTTAVPTSTVDPRASKFSSYVSAATSLIGNVCYCLQTRSTATATVTPTATSSVTATASTTTTTTNSVTGTTTISATSTTVTSVTATATVTAFDTVTVTTIVTSTATVTPTTTTATTTMSTTAPAGPPTCTATTRPPAPGTYCGNDVCYYSETGCFQVTIDQCSDICLNDPNCYVAQYSNGQCVTRSTSDAFTKGDLLISYGHDPDVVCFWLCVSDNRPPLALSCSAEEYDTIIIQGYEGHANGDKDDLIEMHTVEDPTGEKVDVVVMRQLWKSFGVDAVGRRVLDFRGCGSVKRL